MSGKNDPIVDPPADSILDGQQRARRFRAEKRAAEQAAQEQHQRARQARHQELARKDDEEVRARLFLRIMQAQTPQPSAEVPPVSYSTERQDAELEAEQAAGRRALEKYAKKSG